MAGSGGAAGSGGLAGSAGSTALTCPSIQSPKQAGSLKDPAINEASGLAVSRKNKGVLWVHNDSGDSARVFALSESGTTLGTYTLYGASAKDWEDMALGRGPKPGLSYLYVGDIGDNGKKRSDINVYRVVEPSVPLSGPAEKKTLNGVEKFTLKYPDGPHNAEGLMVDANGDVYIVTKESSKATVVFHAKAPLTSSVTLSEVAQIKLGTAPLSGSNLATGADISPAGQGILIRTYTSAFWWLRPPGTSVAQALQKAPCKIPAALEIQGETIAFRGESGYYTVSEGSYQPIWRFGP